MSLLFSEEGLARLDAIVQSGVLCAFDFDGTLAPIVPQPDQARLPPGIRSRLLALAAHAPIAIITGRSVDDIRHRLAFEPDFIIGNHGMEGVPGWEAHAQRHAELCRGWREQLEAVLPQGFDPGIRIEDKRFSLSVHYRLAADRAATEAQLERLFRQLQPEPRVVWGKLVFSLMPEDAGHKGSALEQLMAMTQARSAVYVGDDITDEDVFRLQRPEILSIRIEHAPHSAAELHVSHPADIVRLLDELTHRLRAAGASNWLQDKAACSA
jgi:trehalose 6-phosphate phosphatase